MWSGVQSIGWAGVLVSLSSFTRKFRCVRVGVEGWGGGGRGKLGRAGSSRCLPYTHTPQPHPHPHPHACSYCIEVSEKASEVDKRLGLLSAHLTQFTFHSISRGLFEEHKPLFAFLVATALLRHPSG